MPELEDIVQNIALSGQDDVIDAFGEIGKAAVEAFKRAGEAVTHLNEGLGSVAEVVGGLAAAYAGVIGATGLWAEHSASVVHSLEMLSKQSGESVEDVSALQGAFTALGGDASGLEGAFRRMGITIAGQWDSIKKDIASASDQAINDTLKVEKAEQALFHAQEERKKVYGYPGATERQLEIEKQAEANTKQEAAEQALFEARKKRQQDLLNAPAAYAKAIQEIITGEKSFAQAGMDANLSVDNTLKGLIINTEGAKKALAETGEAGQHAFSEDIVDQLKNFKGSLQDISSATPKTLEVLLNLADFIKNSGNAAMNQAQVMRLFGRYVGSEMLIPLSQGSAAIKEWMERMKQAGLVITEDMAKPATEFHEAFQRLSYDLTTTVNQIGLLFAPTFTQGFKDLTQYIEQNHAAIMTWAEDLASKVTPYVQGFFDALKGLAAYLAGDALDPESNAGKWEKTWERIANAVKTAVGIIQSVLNTVKGALATLFGGQGSDYTNIEALIGGLAAWKIVGGKAGGIFLAGFLGALTGGGLEGALVAMFAGVALKAITTVVKGAGGGLLGLLTGGALGGVAGTAGAGAAGAGLGASEAAAAGGGGLALGALGSTALIAGLGLIIGVALEIGFEKVIQLIKDKLFPKPELPKPPGPGEEQLTMTEKVVAAIEHLGVAAASYGQANKPFSEILAEKEEQKRVEYLRQSTQQKPTPEMEGFRQYAAEHRIGATTTAGPPIGEQLVREGTQGERSALSAGLSKQQQSTLLDLLISGGKPPEKARVPQQYAEQMFGHIQSTMAAGEPLSKEAKKYLDELASSAKGAAEGVSKLGEKTKSWEPHGPIQVGPERDLRGGDGGVVDMVPPDVRRQINEARRQQGLPVAAEQKPAADNLSSMLEKLFGTTDKTSQGMDKAGTAAETFANSAEEAARRLLEIQPQGGGGGGGGGGGSSEAPAATAGTEGFATGGLVGGSEGHDTNIIRATKGEYVVRKDGGNLGAAIAHFTKGFAEGGLVGGFVESMRIPGYATGGVVVHTASVGAGGSSGRPIELHIGGEKVSGLTANESAANQISRIAVERAVRSGYSGGKSSWYRGS